MQTVNWYKNSKELKIRMCLSIQKNYWQVSLAKSSTNNREMSNILFILLPLVVAQEVSELLILNSWFNLLHTTITTTIKQVILSYRPWSQPPSQKTHRWTLPPPGQLQHLDHLERRWGAWKPSRWDQTSGIHIMADLSGWQVRHDPASVTLGGTDNGDLTIHIEARWFAKIVHSVIKNIISVWLEILSSPRIAIRAVPTPASGTTRF